MTTPCPYKPTDVVYVRTDYGHEHRLTVKAVENLHRRESQHTLRLQPVRGSPTVLGCQEVEV